MSILWLDFETRSECDLKSRGAYNYSSLSSKIENNMNTWKEKVKIDRKVYTVKEATDKECMKSEDRLAPISHGFVNLYNEENQFITFCGVIYAREHRMTTSELAIKRAREQ